MNGRLVDRKTLLEYLKRQPTQRLRILIDPDTGEGVEAHQTGDGPPVSRRFSDKSERKE